MNSYVVIVERVCPHELDTRCFGPYRKFIAAARDARAIPPNKGKAYVLRVEPLEDLP